MNRTLNSFTLSMVITLLGAIITLPAQGADCYLDTDDNGTGDSTAGAESNGNNGRLACGSNANATGDRSTALGSGASAAQSDSTALGTGADAAFFSTAVGSRTDATANFATAVGGEADVSSLGATTLGYFAQVPTNSPGAIAIGYRAGTTTSSPGAIAIGGDSNGSFPGANALSAHSIALGDEARINSGATGSIAIGGDVDGDGIGAQALAPNSIALGADVVADLPDQMFVGMPIRVVPPSVGVTEKVLMRLENLGGVNFKLNDTTTANGEWTFRTGSFGSKFVIGKTGSGVQEFQVFSGGNVTIAGNLTQSSSRTKKENIEDIDTQAILAKVTELPISEWNYKQDDDAVKHIGPMAEDFYSLFQIGQGPKTLSSIDTGGIALAAIQALKAEKDREISGLKQTIVKKEARITELEQTVAELRRQQTRVDALEQVVTQLLSDQAQTLRKARLVQ